GRFEVEHHVRLERQVGGELDAVVADDVARVRVEDRIVAHLESEPVAVREGPGDPPLGKRMLHLVLDSRPADAGANRRRAGRYSIPDGSVLLERGRRGLADRKGRSRVGEPASTYAA